MRRGLVDIYRVVHTWTGIIPGALLFIAFYAGALTVFKEPLGEWATPPVTSEARLRGVPLDETPALIEATLEARPDAGRGFFVDLSEEGRVDRLEWEVRPEGADEHDNLSVTHLIALPRPDGTVQVEEVERSKVGEFVHMLHSVVGLPLDSEPSRIFMGLVSMLYFVALISGLMMILPRFFMDLFALKVDHKVRRVWRHAHLAVGMVSLPFHVVIALTATVFAFHDPIYGIQNFTIHEGRIGEVFRGPPPEDPVPHDPADLLPPREIAEHVVALAPDFEPTRLHYVGVTGPKPVVRVWGEDPAAVAWRPLGGLAMLDPYSGDVVTTAYLPGKQGVGGTVLSALFASHFGTYGGPLVKGIYFAFGLLGAWLFYTGNLLWVEARRKKQGKRPGSPVPEQRPVTRWMAAGSVGVCLGTVCGISATLAAAKVLHALGLHPDAWFHTVYYGVFLASVGWALWRGAPRASVHLLGAAAALTLAIPVLSLLGALFPGTGLWGHLDLVGIDLAAVAMGAMFAGMGVLTARRAFRGAVDSVWSAARGAPREAAPT